MDQTTHNNSLLQFTQAVGSEASSANTMAWNKRYSAITLNRSLLSSTYAEEGIVQVLIDQPVDDAFRGGITIHCPELDADDINLLMQDIEDLDVLTCYSQALKWNRLFGGAGIIINFGQDVRQPLNIEQITMKKPLKFYAADRWELSYTPIGMEVMDQFAPQDNEHPYNYYGHVLHKSNVIKLTGKECPSLIRGQLGGWGMSELERLVRNFNSYLKHQSVTFELIDEAKVDIFGIQGFNSAIASPQGAQQTAARVSMAAQLKNYQNALVIDKEDTYESKQMGFAGLAEILKEIRIGLACDVRMPMTKLFGLSASGFNSGEDDIENYNAMVETEIRSKVRKGITTMLQLLCQRRFGMIPETISFEWPSLRMQSSQEQSLIKTETLNRAITAYSSGLMTSEKAVEIINKAKVFDIEIPTGDAMTLEELVAVTDKQPDEAKTSGRRTGMV